MKPLIGITPLWDDEKVSVWMLPGYLDVISKAGGVPIILPLDIDSEDLNQICALCDGFLLSGGHDVNPRVYNQEPTIECGKPCHDRDVLERQIFDHAIKADKPILGICRGIQIINAFCGGDLYQDLPSEHNKGINHQMTAPYNRAVHNVNLTEGSPLKELLKTSVLGVNSYHHQAIKILGQGLKIMAVADDGIIEGIFMPNKKYVQAIQWHPEFSFKDDINSLRIVENFVASCL